MRIDDSNDKKTRPRNRCACRRGQSCGRVVGAGRGRATSAEASMRSGHRLLRCIGSGGRRCGTSVDCAYRRRARTQSPLFELCERRVSKRL